MHSGPRTSPPWRGVVLLLLVAPLPPPFCDSWQVISGMGHKWTTVCNLSVLLAATRVCCMHTWLVPSFAEGCSLCGCTSLGLTIHRSVDIGAVLRFLLLQIKLPEYAWTGFSVNVSLHFSAVMLESAAARSCGSCSYCFLWRLPHCPPERLHHHLLPGQQR